MTLSLARFAGLAAATVAGVCALGAWPTWQIAGAGGLVAMGAAAGLASITAILGYLPTSFTRAGDAYETRANAFMIGLGLRLFVTLGALTAVWFAGVPQRGVVVAWTGVLYGVLLVVELIVVARSLRDPAPSPHAPRPTA